MGLEPLVDDTQDFGNRGYVVVDWISGLTL